MAKIFTNVLERLGLGRPAPAPVVQDYAKAGALPRNMRGTVSVAGSYFGYYGPPLRNNRFQPTPFNPDHLVQRKGLKIYRTMAQDEQIKAAISAKQFAVLSTGYDILLPELPDDADQAAQDAADEQKEFLEFNFAEMKGGLESKLLGVMDAMIFGYSVSEKVFDYVDYGQFEGKWMLKDLRTRPPEDIEFQMDQFGNLDPKGVIQFQEALPSEKFVIYSYGSKYGNLYGESDLRAAYRAWWMKDNMLKLMAVALERYAEPIADAAYEGLPDQATRDAFEDFFKNLQSRSGIFHPATIEIQFHNPPSGAAESFIPAINLYDQHMRIAVLMPGLIGLSGEQQTGSFARAVKEFDSFLWILGMLRKDIETVINEQIIKPLIDMNFEVEHGQYPKFKFNEVTEDARHKQYELFLTGLGAGGLQLGPNDQNKLRELINFEPLPEDFEQIDPTTGYPPGEQPTPEEQMKLQAELTGGFGGGFGAEEDAGWSDDEPLDEENVGDEEALEFSQEKALVRYVEMARKDYHLPGEHEQQAHAGDDAGGGSEFPAGSGKVGTKARWSSVSNPDWARHKDVKDGMVVAKSKKGYVVLRTAFNGRLEYTATTRRGEKIRSVGTLREAKEHVGSYGAGQDRPSGWTDPTLQWKDVVEVAPWDKPRRRR